MEDEEEEEQKQDEEGAEWEEGKSERGMRVKSDRKFTNETKS